MALVTRPPKSYRMPARHHLAQGIEFSRVYLKFPAASCASSVRELEDRLRQEAVCLQTWLTLVRRDLPDRRVDLQTRYRTAYEGHSVLLDDPSACAWSLRA